ncbi:NAD(P)/FAD-dependent oxidoreductase [Candidatus Chlorohelix sp.]|uniref:NAD(P)/FAD-dependent oxidoreductase n=1 Tax=Candidatus Chlorohelix sp. TaxID=3139201 RepID=UPI00302B9283
MKRLVILGAGYGGLALAQKLVSLSKGHNSWKVTLVDHRDYHLIQVRIHEVAANSIPAAQIKIPLSELLQGHKVESIQAKVIKIDPVGRTVETTSGSISYDRLVVALGSVTDFHNIPGLQEHAFAMKTLDEAILYRKAVVEAFRKATAAGAEPLRKNDPRLTFTIIGGGLTGTELAGEMVDFCNDLCKKFPTARNAYRIVLAELTPHLLPELGAENGDYAMNDLRRKNVAILTNSGIDQVLPGSVHLINGKTIKSNIICWTGGVKAPPLVKESGFETTRDGRIEVNHNLRSKQFESVYAIGDNAFIHDGRTGKPVPQTGQYAELQAAYLAKCFAHEQPGVTPEPYTPFSMGISISLGRGEALSLSGPLKLTGMPGRVVKDLSYTKHELGVRNVLPEVRLG